ncbi:Uncharacterized protein TCM_031214 [Theobroma cacao]|uniref:S-locus glycoprotein domain-containing protein n=1 Tax=Theobroma cacao TaxID=3641 RepID=A0A061F761_THECC|nr:Uncharacterized protein TCM_031214 [Theobroma cacao]
MNWKSFNTRLHMKCRKQAWMLFSFAPRDYCDRYGLCGSKGNCDGTQLPLFKGFKP